MEPTIEEKRWVITGIALNKVVIPMLRPQLKQAMEREYETLKSSHGIDAQTSPKPPPPLLPLPAWLSFNYQNINGNETRTRSKYDYRIQSAVDLGKLCLAPYKFTAYNETCDGSAVLNLLGRVPGVDVRGTVTDVRAEADDVRRNVRNECAHAIFNDWNQTKFTDCFENMKNLLKVMGLPDAEVIDWEKKGVALCMNSPDDQDLRRMVQHDVAQLRSEVSMVNLDVLPERERIIKGLSDKNERLNELETEQKRQKERQDELEEEDRSLREIVRSQEVPDEIVARGPEARAAYQEALADGKTKDRRIPVMVIGQARAGKTSTIKSLKGRRLLNQVRKK